MGTLLTICPVTAREIATGIETDRSTMERVASFVGQVHCPWCGGEHALSKSNAWVSEQIADKDFFSPAALGRKIAAMVRTGTPWPGIF